MTDAHHIQQALFYTVRTDLTSTLCVWTSTLCVFFECRELVTVAAKKYWPGGRAGGRATRRIIIFTTVEVAAGN